MDSSLHKKILDNLYDAVYFVDQERRITYWNDAAAALTGFDADQVVGSFCHNNILRHVDEHGRLLCWTSCPLSKTLADGRSRQAVHYLHHRKGHRIPVSVRVTPVTDEQGRIVGAAEIFRDQSPALETQIRLQELEKLSLVDALTELPNRRYLEITLQSRLSEQDRYGWTCAALFMDLDGFKSINDAYGHAMGDEVLKVTAKTLAASVRSFDLVGRWGGEEFVAVLTRVQRHDAQVVAERCRELLAQSSVRTTEKPIPITISIGGTLSQPGDTLETIIARADEMMYHCKDLGGNRVCLA